jgi:NTP pyrophosphatase (non-canonical NTP hydrolase)
MKQKNIGALVQDYKKIEKEIYLSIDDVIHKVTQEVGELIEADMNGNISETYKEANDVIVNVCSVAQELWLNMDFWEKKEENIKDPRELSITLWKWNTKIQWLRKRYTREDVKIEQVQEITWEFIRLLLEYSDPDLSIEDIIVKNTEKFRSRAGDYIGN